MQARAASESATAEREYDILVIGGGINGAGVARDAAGRGFSVCLCETGDFAGETSSASTKLLHGGLRYLEYFEFGLVRESLEERENLLAAMPHISWPMRFVIPYYENMRFDSETPASKLLSIAMPWMKGRRPAWLIRLGLFLYDHIGGRRLLPGTATLDLRRDDAGRPLKPKFERAFEYSDCCTMDSRLVILNLRDAQTRGAAICPRTRVTRAEHGEGGWRVALVDQTTGEKRTVKASMIVNAAGPWVDEVLGEVFGRHGARNVRLVRGSHIVVPAKFDHGRSYLFQNGDGRIIFAIPYENEYTLIGTTDADNHPLDQPAEISAEETEYLCRAASEFFAYPVDPKDIVWTYSGIRPLFDDGTAPAQAATRSYVVRRDSELGNGSVVHIFGGKITTFRRLAETVLVEVEHILGKRGERWTRRAPFPGGDFAVDGFEALVVRAAERFAFLSDSEVRRLVRCYGTEVDAVLNGAESRLQLGRDFGNGLHELEVSFLMKNEWALTAEDVLFRRTRLGIAMERSRIAALDAWMKVQRNGESQPRDTARERKNQSSRR